MEKLLTPDAPSGEVAYKQLLITVPSNVDLMRYLVGAWQGIAYLNRWQDSGTLSAFETATLVKETIRSIKEFSMLGTIQAVVRDSLDNSMLLCDGSVYNKVDYPDLWEVLPSAMKDATTLTLPDLRNLFLVGAGMDYSLADTGGEAEVTLTVGQIPSHAHGYTQPTFGVDIESVGVPDPTGVGNPPLPQLTDAEGGDEAHNNLPPYYAVVYAIVAKVRP